MREFLKDEMVRVLVFGLLVLIVILTAAFGRPRRTPVGVEFPAPLGARLVFWVLMALWALLVLAPLEFGWYWLSALLLLGPVYTLSRWPETISLTEAEIRQSAWCRAEVSILWTEVETIALSDAGDSLVVCSRDGRKIEVSSWQVGAATLISEIERWSGHPCPALHQHV